ncbi:MAG: hypothetical protein JSR36_04635 [Proteobacteria bacterium]|nr:hypothetical protein [Pseudomonadota bacterium]
MTGTGTQVNAEQLLARKRALDACVSATPQFAARLGELRTWQGMRLARTYRDLRREPRYAAAVEFFLCELYGAQDFRQRDRDVTRAWSAFRRALPRAAVDILTRAIELEVLTTELDHAMAARLSGTPITGVRYANAYRAVGQGALRRRQIQLAIAVGEALDRIVRYRWVGIALRAAHVPARAAGFGALQDFLERGFASFRRVHGAQALLTAIRERETQLMDALFGGAADPFDLEDTGTMPSE